MMDEQMIASRAWCSCGDDLVNQIRKAGKPKCEFGGGEDIKITREEKKSYWSSDQATYPEGVWLAVDTKWEQFYEKGKKESTNKQTNER